MHGEQRGQRVSAVAAVNASAIPLYCATVPQPRLLIAMPANLGLFRRAEKAAAFEFVVLQTPLAIAKALA